MDCESLLTVMPLRCIVSILKIVPNHLSKTQMGAVHGLTKMGALALVQNGDDVLTNLGIGRAKYADLMRQLRILSYVYLMLSWFGLSYFAPQGLHQCNPNHSIVHSELAVM